MDYVYLTFGLLKWMTDPSSLIMFTSSMPGMLLTANNQIIIIVVLPRYKILWQNGNKCMNLIEVSGINKTILRTQKQVTLLLRYGHLSMGSQNDAFEKVIKIAKIKSVLLCQKSQ